MSKGALKKILKQYVKEKKGSIVGTPFSDKGDYENYLRSEIRKGKNTLIPLILMCIFIQLYKILINLIHRWIQV